MNTLLALSSGVVGSLITLILNHFYTQWKDSKEKRERIFRTLMSTRGFRAFPAHVEALCNVEVEWTGKDDGGVHSTWKAYNHHLNKLGVPTDTSDPANIAWTNELEELFANMIVALGDSIGKPQDKTDVKRGAYGPRSWWEYEQETSLLRKGLLNIIYGQGMTIPVSVNYDQHVQQQLSALVDKAKAPALPAP
jgi:hypothetical protein